MKQCPVCKNTYTDDSLSFCLSDGAALAVAPSSTSEATQQMTFGSIPTLEINQPNPVNIQSKTTAPFSVPPITTQQSQPKSTGKFLILTIVALLAFIGIAGAAGAYFVFVNKNDAPPAASSPTPAVPTVQPSAQTGTPDETRAIKEELEKLKKQVNERSAKKTDSTVSSPTQKPAGKAMARVNSPGDGFLSLRTEPSVKTGVQLVKIPTEAIVQLEDCQRTYVVIDTKRGRWCLVSYNGQTGWVFDAWLVY